MAINTDLLIAAAILQDTFVDKTGVAMSAGTITCYEDTSRTTLKNWYYQSGTPGNYTYIRLPNPLTLSAAGTICDINGVDTIPFWYPYDEADETVSQPYYVTIVNYAQTNQITRANFPFTGSGNASNTGTAVNNLIINNEFWRNVGTVDLTSTLFSTVCPSQHDGFQYPDITFQKNVTGGADTLTFTAFDLTDTEVLTDDITPEYYINHTCSSVPTGETLKAYYFPISLHINTLASVPFTATIQAENVGGTGTGENTITLYIFQDTGDGTTTPDLISLGSITVSTAWTKYQFSSNFPGTAGLTLSGLGDDALYLLVQMPLNVACSINFCRPSIYLNSVSVPSNDFQTYDQVDRVISSPRTGDIRISLNSFSPMGWVAANDGTIGSADSSATTRANADTWQLYSLIWNNVSNTYAPVTGGRGASAYADFTANKPMQLTLALSRVFGVAGSGSGLTTYTLGQTAGAESDSTALSISNMPAHDHTGSTIDVLIAAPVGSSIVGAQEVNGTVFSSHQPTLSIASQGSGTAFSTSTIQPSVFYHAFFKL